MNDDYITNIIDSTASAISKHGKQGVILAGHYCVAKSMGELSCDNKVEQLCFEIGVRLAKKCEENNLANKLVLWINDIGIDIEERNELKKNYKLPIPYKKILEKYVMMLFIHMILLLYNFNTFQRPIETRTTNIYLIFLVEE